MISKVGYDNTVIQSSKKDEEKIYSNSNYGLVYSLTEAYNKHHNIILRPDDFWVAVLNQFSFYVNKHSETLKDKFVNFHGKKDLRVMGGGTLFTADYDELALSMSNKIQEYLIDENVKEWILPDFSTLIITIK